MHSAQNFLIQRAATSYRGRLMSWQNAIRGARDVCAAAQLSANMPPIGGGMSAMVRPLVSAEISRARHAADTNIFERLLKNGCADLDDARMHALMRLLAGHAPRSAALLAEISRKAKAERALAVPSE